MNHKRKRRKMLRAGSRCGCKWWKFRHTKGSVKARPIADQRNLQSAE